MKKGNLFVLSGPSGSGKTTLAKKLASQSANIILVISYTTRVKREGEVDGEDYNFVTIQEFKKMLKNDEFAEWAEVFGNYYGTPLYTVNDSLNDGKDVLLEIDVEGAKQIKKKFNHSVHIFILAPDMKELEQRLVRRNTDNSEEIKNRLSLADEEITKGKNYDYTVINNELNRSLAEIKKIIEIEKNKQSL